MQGEKNEHFKEIDDFKDTNTQYLDILKELKRFFKGTDSLAFILVALIEMGEIDDEGNTTEKAKLLLETIMSNKIKDNLSKE